MPRRARNGAEVWDGLIMKKDLAIAKRATSTEDREAESSESFHKRLLDSLYDGVYFVDTERRITYWNQGAQSITGYSPAEAVGTHCFDNLLMHVDGAGRLLCMEGCPLSSTLRDGERRECEVYLRHSLGHRVPVRIRVSPMFDNIGQIVGAVEVFTDVTANKKLERRATELESFAFHDPLTGVSNRRLVEVKVKQALQEVVELGRAFGLIMLDVDGFKSVNDRYGHDVGDKVLKAVCETLVQSLRPEDVIGRWGGEEFLVVLPDVSSPILTLIAERSRKLVAECGVPVNEQRVHVTLSLGATILQAGDTDASAIKRADELMYQSKAAGRNRTTSR